MIELQNIVKIYKMGEIEVPVLRGLSFHVDRGEMVAIMGPSGCGKSTLMNIMGCLDTPTSGSYFLDSAEVSKLTDSQLAELRNRKIGFVFQTFNLIPRTPAVTNVELPMLYGNATNRTKRAMEALEKVGLVGRAQHKPNQLSGGEQQRVAIARAMVNNPSIILADEPTGNLDSKAGLEIIHIMKRLNVEEGITIILVTHERDLAVHAQRIVSLRDGQVVGEEKISQYETRASVPSREIKP
ncbi:MAG: ABC transporter ATP-binding protein [Dehalococcoidales bacterium]|nr:ABC transporter ATP-binding protein [Dehalococcoidales bacterium]